MLLIAGDSDKGQRLDIWLSGALKDLSRARIQDLIRNGFITSSNRALKPNTKVIPGLEVNIELPEPEPVDLIAENIPLDTIYEDADILVVNKPAGMVVHPAAGHSSGTLVNAVLHHCADLKGIGGEIRPGIVHRLDKDTTGLMVIAKTQEAMDGLAAQFKAGKVKKEYIAIVHGKPDPEEGVVETLIGRSNSDRKKMSAKVSSGKRAVTRYKVKESLGAVSLVDLVIETGRTHQIRVHMAHIGNPVVGDPQYGSRRKDRNLKADRQMLHARLLSLSHPITGEVLTWQAPLPDDFVRMVEFFRKEKSDNRLDVI